MFFVVRSGEGMKHAFATFSGIKNPGRTFRDLYKIEMLLILWW